MATEIPNLLSTAEAAAVLGISDSLVRRYVREKRLPAKRLGERSYGILKKDVDTFKKTPRKPGPPSRHSRV